MRESTRRHSRERGNPRLVSLRSLTKNGVIPLV